MRNNIILYMLLPAIILLGTMTTAHEHWMDLSQFHAAKNSEVTITIASGHRFPESKMALNDVIINQCDVIKGKGSTPFTTRAKEKKRTGRFEFKEDGVFLVETNLKRPQVKEPLYYARAIILVGEQTGTHKDEIYKTGKGLEIVPLGNLETMKANDTLRLAVYYKGERVKRTCSFSTANGKQFFLTPKTDGTVELKIGKKEKKYLVTTSHKGIGCSLTFALK